MKTERQMIGEGTYGCVHRPALKCEKDTDFKGNRVDYSGTISKVSDTFDMLEEMKQYQTIEKIDKDKKYYTGTPVMCQPKINADFRRAVDKCLIKGQQYKNGHVGLLIMKDGGTDLEKFAKSLLNLNPDEPNNRKIVDDFWKEMLRILEGIQFFQKNKVIHFDLKEGNIVYDVNSKRANFIDFGTLIEKKRVEDEAKKDYCSKCINHWSYPFENHFLNRREFNEEYKHYNVRLFLTTLNDVFTVGFEPDEDIDVKLKVIKNREKLLIDKSKKADDIPLDQLNNKSHIVILYKEIKSPNLPHLLTDFLQGIHDFFKQYNEWTHEAFVKKSLDTFDIFGVGIAFLYVLKYAKPFMNIHFFDDLYNLSFRMITPNLKHRYTVAPLLSDYKKLLKKHLSFSPSSVVLSNTLLANDCPDGKIRNPKTGRCIKNPVKSLKDCPDRKVLNPKTGRCVKTVNLRTTRVLSRATRKTRVLPRRTQ